jgi:class 3 adenylate cyclase/tetratricopeptide (TPR) repeat protein
MGCGARLAEALRPDARKPVTILFNDVAESTSLGERFEAETVRRIMSRYFQVVSSVFERHGGTVEKFIGDAAMAVFGMAAVQEDHALRAVRAAAELKAALARLNEELEHEYGVRIATRTGINSGEVVTGDPAGGQALVTGDPVNVAARLEQAAAPEEILIGETTRHLVGEAATVERVEPLVLKGKDEPVSAWRVLDVVSKKGQPARRLDGPMLGREQELASLCDLFDRVTRERTVQRALVFGPAGIGKSRLAHELEGAVAGRASVFRGSCLPYGEGITYWPLAEIVREAAGDEPRAAIAGLLAADPHAEVIADRVLQAAGLAEGGGAGKDLTWAIRRFCEALAARQPTLIVFEDIHWAEPAMLDLIEYLSSSTHDVPLMLLCLARQDLLEQRPDWGRSDHHSSSIVLERLSDANTSELIDELLPGALSKDVRAQLLARAEGNPLFIEQMLAFLREPGLAAEQIAIPPTIHALIAARLDRLSLDELAAIGAASVIGEEFWPGAVEALSGRDGRSMAELARKELIRPERSTLAGEDGFAFRHGLIRDAAYEALTKEDRAALHERFANWLERHHRPRLIELEAILGYHLEQAYSYRAQLGRVDEEARALARRAATRLGSAGRRAARAREDAAAVSLLRRAGKLLPQAGHERLELLPLIGESLEGTANHTEAVQVYGEALEDALAASHRAVEGRARLGRAHAWFVANPERSLDEIIAEAERAIVMLEEVGDERGLAEAWRLVGEARFYQGNAAEGQRALERALGQLGPDGSARTLNALLFSMGICLLDGPTPLERAVAFAEERLDLARAKSLPSLEADMLHVLGTAEGRRGNLERARQTLADSTAISEELGLAYMAQWSKRSLGRVELAAGNAEAAEQALRSSFDLLTQMGLKGSLGESAVPLADALFEQGRHDEAARMLETVPEELASGDASTEAPRLCVRAKLFAAQGWHEHAERAIRRASRLVLRTDWACLETDTLIAQAAVLRLADRLGEAVPSLRDALAIAKQKGYQLGAGQAGELLALASQARTGPSGQRLS